MRMISLVRARAALAGIGILAVSVTTAVGASVPASAQTLTWSVVPSPSRGTDSVLEGVSCVSPMVCTAAGYYATSGGPGRTLVESWNGTSWSVVPSPNRGGSHGGSFLYDVSCVSATACTAAGTYIHTSTSGGHNRTLIESWNGTSWSVVPSPSRGTESFLDGVSCVSATACTAVGYYVTSGGPGRTLVESWTAPAGRWCPAPAPGLTASSTACPASRRPRAPPQVPPPAPAARA